MPDKSQAFLHNKQVPYIYVCEKIKICVLTIIEIKGLMRI